MSRFRKWSKWCKWSAPVAAFGLLFSLAAVRVMAEDAKKETGTVSGVVMDKDGKPLSGVEVGVYHPMGRHAAAAKSQGQAEGEKPEKPKAEKPVPVVPSVKSDDKGEFTLSEVPVGDYTVIARLRGQGQARENVTVKAGETAKVELKLTRGAGKAAGGAGASEKKPEGGEK